MGDSDSDFTAEIARVAGLGMQWIVQNLQGEEDEDEVNSHPVRRQPIYRDRLGAHNRLVSHYFSSHPLYPPSVFRRRFRMHRPLFLRIVHDITNISPYMRQTPNASGSLGFSELQKCAVAMRQLAYGSVSDSWDEYFQMAQRTALESLDEFCRCIITLYWKRYMRRPTPSDVQALYAHHSMHHGLPGMLGSLDCLHWEWDGCRVSNHGQYTQGNKKHPTMILEAVASQDLWFWHAYFGPPGSNNDLNVLQMSPLFDHYLNGSSCDTSFEVNETHFPYGYYLVDGIYHEWGVFVKTIGFPDNAVGVKFKRAQERARKDIERAFGAMKKRFGILKWGARSTDRDIVARIMYTCCILHNMILEDEGKAVCTYVPHENVVPNPPPIQPGSEESIQIRRVLRNRPTHHLLRAALGQHLQTVHHVDLNEIPEDDAEDFSGQEQGS